MVILLEVEIRYQTLQYNNTYNPLTASPEIFPMNLPAHFHIHTEPLAESSAIVQTAHARFTVLTERLIRIEYSPTGEFEDRPSQAFWFRKQPRPAFDLKQTDDQIEIETAYLHLRYKTNLDEFTRRSLTILVKATGVEWHYGDSYWPSGQLYGTARTLDGVSGATRLDLGPMARSGWAVIDDSKSVVFTEDGWVEPRPPHLASASCDLYFFGHGHDYLAALRDYTKISGPTPMIPRYILGNWWSRYWAYTQAELTGLMQQFHDHGIPLAVCIVDMDWHLAGWTGYTWNRNLWPDPQGFIEWLHGMGLRTALNLHPADGVGPHEAQYEAMAAATGLDPASQEPVRFDIASPAFALAYFDLLHHPYEKMGVDFWWMDWQQERVTKMPGLDPLWWLNHLHYFDLGRTGKRPFVFSRWGGYGNHRYPIGFSGDTHITWDSLAYQPYFTATAANVAYGWWSHDIGGHMGGIEDDELYARWIQFGAFSPILRMHCTNNPYHERRPWGRSPAAEKAATRALRLRHQLIPYLYSMAWRDHAHHIPLVTPMYYGNPEDDAAYNAEGQYWFGSELVMAPFTAPAEKSIGLSRQRVWLPEGVWFDFFRGEQVAGGKWQVIYGDLMDIPAFAKAGAIVPLAPEMGWGGVENPAWLAVHVFPGADNHFDLYEDDGESQAYQQGAYAITPFNLEWRGQSLKFAIGPVRGQASLAPGTRHYQILIHAIGQPSDVWLTVNGKPRATQWAYNAATETLTVETGNLHPADAAVLEVGGDAPTLLSATDHRPARLRRLLWAMQIDTWLKNAIDQHIPLLLEGKVTGADAPGLSDAQMAAIANVIRTQD
jgi:alpha-glucosidase (family GH31 glycosyl hydrolase)